MARARRSGRRRGLVRTLNYLAFLPLATRAPTYGRLLLALLRDERVPTAQKALLGAAAVYVLAPYDLVPEWIPVLGALDDLVVAVLAVDVFLDGVPEALLEEKLDQLGISPRELERDLAQVRRMVPRPVRRLASRLPDLVAEAGALIKRSAVDQRLRAWILKEESPA